MSRSNCHCHRPELTILPLRACRYRPDNACHRHRCSLRHPDVMLLMSFVIVTYLPPVTAVILLCYRRRPLRHCDVVDPPLTLL